MITGREGGFEIAPKRRGIAAETNIANNFATAIGKGADEDIRNAFGRVQPELRQDGDALGLRQRNLGHDDSEIVVPAGKTPDVLASERRQLWRATGRTHDGYLRILRIIKQRECAIALDTGDRHNILNFDQPLPCGDGSFGAGLVVCGDELNHGAIGAASGVDLLGGNFSRLEACLTPGPVAAG